jgi:EAL domain-containing protein (putative c-di-GMP-specific phosphodiesterase class I)
MTNTTEGDPIEAAMRAMGVKALAFGPIQDGDQVGGVVIAGTRDTRSATLVAEKMPALVGFGASANTHLVQRLRARRVEVDLRRSIETVLRTRAFRTVFQPIVELESGEHIGYEALTRFDSGERPDTCFGHAGAVGLGPELELATLEAAIASARELPAGRWLSLNASPRLLAGPDRLATVLGAAERPIILEITEHEKIVDYVAIRDAVRALPNRVRLAVDDAGVGIANFGHIVELRPDLVKIDISLVRRVNADLGRQALVVAMRHFARTSGCRLIAEGVESEEEARTLTELGVEFGQGYLFGRAEPVDHWALTVT